MIQSSGDSTNVDHTAAAQQQQPPVSPSSAASSGIASARGVTPSTSAVTAAASNTMVPIDGTNVYVASIPDDCSENDLKELFSRFGDVLSCRLCVSREASHESNRNFGFVMYRTRESAAHAIRSLDGYALGNAPLRVRLSRRAPSAAVMAELTGEGYQLYSTLGGPPPAPGTTGGMATTTALGVPMVLPPGATVLSAAPAGGVAPTAPILGGPPPSRAIASSLHPQAAAMGGSTAPEIASPSPQHPAGRVAGGRGTAAGGDRSGAAAATGMPSRRQLARTPHNRYGLPTTGSAHTTTTTGATMAAMAPSSHMMMAHTTVSSTTGNSTAPPPGSIPTSYHTGGASVHHSVALPTHHNHALPAALLPTPPPSSSQQQQLFSLPPHAQFVNHVPLPPPGSTVMPHDATYAAFGGGGTFHVPSHMAYALMAGGASMQHHQLQQHSGTPPSAMVDPSTGVHYFPTATMHHAQQQHAPPFHHHHQSQQQHHLHHAYGSPLPGMPTAAPAPPGSIVYSTSTGQFLSPHSADVSPVSSLSSLVPLRFVSYPPSSQLSPVYPGYQLSGHVSIQSSSDPNASHAIHGGGGVVTQPAAVVVPPPPSSNSTSTTPVATAGVVGPNGTSTSASGTAQPLASFPIMTTVAAGVLPGVLSTPPGAAGDAAGSRFVHQHVGSSDSTAVDPSSGSTQLQRSPPVVEPSSRPPASDTSE